MVQEIVEKITNYLNSDNIISFAYLFGSYAKGKEKHSSDIDIAIYLFDISAETHFDYKMKIKFKLEDILKKQVDIVVLNFAPPLLKNQVFRYGKLLKCIDKSFMNNFKIKSFYQYCDYSHTMNIVLNSNKKRIAREAANGR